MLKSDLDRLLLENVVTLSYRKQDGAVRDMVCTKSAELLQSFEGENLLGFTQPKHSPRYNIDATDNIIVWDIEAKSYRTVAAARATVKETLPGGKYRELLIKNKLG